MKRIILSTAILACLASPALALDLAGARAAGKVCEKGDGYIAAKSADANELAATVNAGRKAEYTRISAEKSQPVELVAKLAGEQLLKTQKGCN